MRCVGLDIHTKHLALCVLSQTGQVVRRARGRGLPPRPPRDLLSPTMAPGPGTR